MSKTKWIFFFLTYVMFFQDALHSQVPDAVHRRGNDLMNAGNHQQSLDYYLSQLNCYPDDENLLYNLAVVYSKINNYRQAEKLLIQLLKHNSNNKNARALLYSIYYYDYANAIAKKKYNLAFDYLNKGLYYLPDNSNFQSLNGELYAKIGEFYQAGVAYKNHGRWIIIIIK